MDYNLNGQTREQKHHHPIQYTPLIEKLRLESREENKRLLRLKENKRRNYTYKVT